MRVGTALNGQPGRPRQRSSTATHLASRDATGAEIHGQRSRPHPGYPRWQPDRPPQLVELLKRIEAGEPYDKASYEACLKELIDEIVRQQVEAGVDIVSDGEFSKGRNWAFYIHDRISGISTREATPEEMKDPMTSAGGGQDMKAFPEFYAEYNRTTGLWCPSWQAFRRHRTSCL